jgi:NTE family protein
MGCRLTASNDLDRQRKTMMHARAFIAALSLYVLSLPGVQDAVAQSLAVAPPASPSTAAAAPLKRVAAVYPTNRPRIGLALSGGGARGFAHVGVLRALETMRIPVDCIAGTSAGSAVAAAYASGLTPDEIEKFLKSADWDRDMFDDLPPRKDLSTRRKKEEKSYLFDITVGLRDGSVVLPPGLISGQKIELFLHAMLGESGMFESFDQLAIPFRAMATDLEAGELVVQDRGSLVTAVRASMAVPSAFAPVQSDGKLLVDGGLTRNMPVDIVRKMCADVVIAVDIGSPLATRQELSNPFGIGGQMISILMERNMRDSRAEIRPGIDVLVRPELGDISAANFTRGIEGIPAGEAAMLAARGDLTRMILPDTDYAAWQAARAERARVDNSYGSVLITGVTPAVERLLLDQAAVPRSGELDPIRMQTVINRWNANADYDRIGYSLQPGNPSQVLQINVIERAWGPDYLHFGMNASADSGNTSMFNVMAGFRRPNANGYGGEFKAEGQIGTTNRGFLEFYQPFDFGRFNLFVAPQLLAEKMPIWIFSGNKNIAQYAVVTEQAGIDSGFQQLLGEARLGVFGGLRKQMPVTGAVNDPTIETTYYGAQASVTIDQLDATDFPRHGYRFNASYRLEQGNQTQPFSADYVARVAQVNARWVGSVGNHTIGGSVRAGEASNPSLNQAFSLGGFMNLSGYQVNQTLGTSLRYGSLSYQYQLLTLPQPLGRGVYAGVALEGAQMQGQILGSNTQGWVPGATLFLGANTAIGPVYAGYGLANPPGLGGSRLWYIFLGRPVY